MGNSGKSDIRTSRSAWTHAAWLIDTSRGYLHVVIHSIKVHPENEEILNLAWDALRNLDEAYGVIADTKLTEGSD